MGKRFFAVGITMLALLLAATATAETRRAIQQQGDLDVFVEIGKEKFGTNPTLEGTLGFEVEGSGIQSVSLRHPSYAQPVPLMPSNPAGMTEIELERSDLWNTLVSMLPDGYYELIVRQSGQNVPFPFLLQRLTLMPERPTITYPAHGQTVSTTPTITWNPVSTNVEVIWIDLDSEGTVDLEFGVDLPANSTSFPVPAGLLIPGQIHEVCVESYMTGTGMSYESSHCVEFMVTGP